VIKVVLRQYYLRHDDYRNPDENGHWVNPADHG